MNCSTAFAGTRNLAEAVPVQKPGKGQQPGSTADLLVGETDWDGFGGSLESNECGHCLVTGFFGAIRCIIVHTSVTSKQRPSCLPNRDGLADFAAHNTGKAATPSDDARRRRNHCHEPLPQRPSAERGFAKSAAMHAADC